MLTLIVIGVGAITGVECESLLSLFAYGQSGGKPPHSKIAHGRPQHEITVGNLHLHIPGQPV